ncbi:MAG: adenosine deaminase [Anaerolineales bacterium]|nr:adenosine deaminase [Anaerolineales bacterium]
MTENSKTKEFYKSLPKVELHRHLEGSLRLSTILELAHAWGLNLPIADPPRLRALVQVQKADPPTSTNFLSKFETLRLFFRSQEVIMRVTREAVADAAADNVRYMELRFTPVALSKAQKFPLDEVMDWVIASARQAEQDFGVVTRLIASVNRHESVSIAETVAGLAVDRLNNGIIGLDLAGAEGKFPAAPFEGVFKEACKAGMRITIHAGEWGGAENIIEAIQTLNAERIGHGVRIFENPYAVDLAIERGTTFEVCPTSNYQSGVIGPEDTHPLARMIDAGLCVTLNTDDPSISNIALSDECYLACEQMALPLDTLKTTISNGLQASFLPNSSQEKLLNSLNLELTGAIQ